MTAKSSNLETQTILDNNIVLLQENSFLTAEVERLKRLNAELSKDLSDLSDLVTKQATAIGEIQTHLDDCITGMNEAERNLADGFDLIVF